MIYSNNDTNHRRVMRSKKEEPIYFGREQTEDADRLGDFAVTNQPRSPVVYYFIEIRQPRVL